MQRVPTHHRQSPGLRVWASRAGAAQLVDNNPVLLRNR
jgi:hypothetical protein